MIHYRRLWFLQLKKHVNRLTDIQKKSSTGSVFTHHAPDQRWSNGRTFCTCPSEKAEPDLQKRLEYTLTPWHCKDYKSQLESKKWFAEKVAKKLASIILFNMPKPVPPELLSHFQELNGHAFHVEKIIPSPKIHAYRNKDSPAVVFSPEEATCKVGFVLRLARHNYTAAFGPLVTLKPLHMDVIQSFQDFLDRVKHQAPETLPHWSELVVRSTEAGQLMVVPVIKELTDQEDKKNKMVDLVREHFLHGPGRGIPITSLQVQQVQVSRHKELATSGEVLHGRDYLEEYLNGCLFRISCNSFFQINTAAAQEMYEAVRDLCGFNQNTILLDVCCGTGTIGIIMAKHVKKVYGIEKIPGAIEDAKRNAAINNTHNIEFILDTAEKGVPNIIDSLQLTPESDVVAIVNPSRKGFGRRVIRALRRCEAIRKVVYISCKPTGNAQFNFVWLCQNPDSLEKRSPKRKMEGKPFIPTVGFGVDMFPFTRHYELILMFER